MHKYKKSFWGIENSKLLTFKTLFANIALMENETNQAKMSEKAGKVYELSFIFVPLLGDDAIPAKFGELKGVLADMGVQFITEEMPRLIPLAYTMERTIINKKNQFSTGYFSWIKFETTAPLEKELNDKLKMNEDIIRFLIIKTVAENTMSPKKGVVRERSSRRFFDKTATREADVPMDKEQVDKKIEEMIV